MERLERWFCYPEHRESEVERRQLNVWNDWNRGNGKLGGQVERLELI